MAKIPEYNGFNPASNRSRLSGNVQPVVGQSLVQLGGAVGRLDDVLEAERQRDRAKLEKSLEFGFEKQLIDFRAIQDEELQNEFKAADPGAIGFSDKRMESYKREAEALYKGAPEHLQDRAGIILLTDTKKHEARARGLQAQESERYNRSVLDESVDQLMAEVYADPDSIGAAIADGQRLIETSALSNIEKDERRKALEQKAVTTLAERQLEDDPEGLISSLSLPESGTYTADNFHSRHYEWTDFRNERFKDAEMPARVVKALDQVTDEFGKKLRITSGYRSKKHNDKVSFSKDSRHSHGDAIDIDLNGLPDNEKARAVSLFVKHGAVGVGHYPDGSVHIDFRQEEGKGPGGLALWYGKNKAYTSGKKWFKTGIEVGLDNRTSVAAVGDSRYSSLGLDARLSLGSRAAKAITKREAQYRAAVERQSVDAKNRILLALETGEPPNPEDIQATVKPEDQLAIVRHQKALQKEANEAKAEAVNQGTQAEYDKAELMIQVGQLSDPQEIMNLPIGNKQKTQLFKAWESREKTFSGEKAEIEKINLLAGGTLEPKDVESLTPEHARSVIEFAKKQEDEVAKETGAMAKYAGNYRFNVATDKKDVDKVFKQLVDPQALMSGDKAQESQALEIISRTGMVPNTFKGAVQSLITSGDDSDFLRGFDLVDRAYSVSPEAVTRDMKDEFIKRYQQYVVNKDILPTDSLVESLRKPFDPIAAEVKKDRSTQAADELKDITADDLLPSFDESYLPFNEPGASLEPGVNRALERDYKVAVTNSFVQLGDMDAAMDFGLQVVKQSWGSSRISGRKGMNADSSSFPIPADNPRMMKHPPFKFHQEIFEDEEEMSTKLGKDVISYVDSVKDSLPEYKDWREYFVVSSVVTNKDIAAIQRGEASYPRYNVMLVLDNGQIVPVMDEKNQIMNYSFADDEVLSKSNAKRKKELEDFTNSNNRNKAFQLSPPVSPFFNSTASNPGLI